MATIKFYGNQTNTNEMLIDHENGSGLGFYGAGYGVSVPIGSTQDSTWLTNSNGTSTQKLQLQNTKYVAPTGVSSNDLTAIEVSKLPNYLCPLNIRFEHSEEVQVQNCKLRIFDRSNIENQATGVSTYVAEIRHPKTDQSASNLNHRYYKGDTKDNKWFEFDPDNAMTNYMLTNSPGASGTNSGGETPGTESTLGWVTNEGSLHQSTRHDWYVALSAEPHSVGSKTQYGLYFSVEYL